MSPGDVSDFLKDYFVANDCVEVGELLNSELEMIFSVHRETRAEQ